MNQQWPTYGGYVLLCVGVGLVVYHFLQPGHHALIAGVVVLTAAAVVLVTAGRLNKR
jgi:hypothetical protein